MKPFYKQAILFWLVLLVLAFINAITRELTYKPWLTPYIGNWAHQISSVTAILLFFSAIYIFLKRTMSEYTRQDLVNAGLIWILLTVVFETAMNIFVRQLSFEEVLKTYYFWQGETWIFVLLSLVISPLVAELILESDRKRNLV